MSLCVARTRTLSPQSDARPEQRWDAALIPQICEWAELGMSQRSIAHALGVSEQLMSKWVYRYEELSTEYRAARARGIATRLKAIRDSMSGGKDGNHDWRADAWMLARAYPEEWGAQREAPSDGKAVNIHNTVTVVTVSADKLKALQQRRNTALEGVASGRN